MSTATGQAAGQAEKPVREKRLDVYDPHFPTRPRVKDASDRADDVTFDPYFPSRKRH